MGWGGWRGVGGGRGRGGGVGSGGNYQAYIVSQIVKFYVNTHFRIILNNK